MEAKISLKSQTNTFIVHVTWTMYVFRKKLKAYTYVQIMRRFFAKNGLWSKTSKAYTNYA